MPQDETKIKKAREEAGTIAPSGGLPAEQPATPAGGPNCPEGHTWVPKNDGSNEGVCVPMEGKGNISPESPEPVEDSTTTSTTTGESKYKSTETSTPVWKANDDLKSERERTLEHLKQLDRAEAIRGIKVAEARVKAKELYAKEKELDARIRTAKEQAKPRAAQVSSTEASTQDGKKTAIASEALSRPAAWYRAVKAEENVPNTFIWHVNKEDIFTNFGGKFTKEFDAQENVVYKPLSEGSGKKSATETIAGPVSTDFMRIMSEQVLVLPNGKVVTPIRQFCETKVLPPGTKEAFFYDFGTVDFGAITEGSLMSDSSATVRSSGGSTTPRGTMLTINYTQVEESPIDLIAAANRSFALESINDESKQVLTSYNTDAGSSGDASNRKAVGGGSKTNFWVDGNTGAQITSDSSGLGKLTLQGLISAKGVIEDQGLDPSNLVCYTSGKAIRDLIFDPNLDSYIAFSRPAIITEATIERIAGVNLVRSSAISSASQSGAKRSALFIPNIAFGLVTGRDLTMEAQRRNELQVIYLSGTQKINGFVKNVEATCRLSHL